MSCLGPADRTQQQWQQPVWELCWLLCAVRVRACCLSWAGS